MVKKNQEKTTSMCLILTVCSGSILIFEIMLPKTMAYRKDATSKVNEYTVEDHRTHMNKHNYLVQRDMNSDVMDDTFDLVYPPTPPEKREYNAKSEELPALIVDYANMIRNNIILLDNSVETRTRKRGNIKVKKYSVPIDPPCTCELNDNEDPIDLGEDYYPRLLKSANCSKELCPQLYECQKMIYYQTVLRKKYFPDEKSSVEVHKDLMSRWVAVKHPVTTGCICKRDYIRENELNDKF